MSLNHAQSRGQCSAVRAPSVSCAPLQGGLVASALGLWGVKTSLTTPACECLRLLLPPAVQQGGAEGETAGFPPSLGNLGNLCIPFLTKGKTFVRTRTTQAVVLNLGSTFRSFFLNAGASGPSPRNSEITRLGSGLGSQVIPNGLRHHESKREAWWE